MERWRPSASRPRHRSSRASSCWAGSWWARSTSRSSPCPTSSPWPWRNQAGPQYAPTACMVSIHRFFFCFSVLTASVSEASGMGWSPKRQLGSLRMDGRVWANMARRQGKVRTVRGFPGVRERTREATIDTARMPTMMPNDASVGTWYRSLASIFRPTKMRMQDRPTFR